MFNLCVFYQGTVNERLHVQSDECRYSCDIQRGEHPYLCEVCNKAFSKKSSLVRHNRTHSGDGPYICDVCNKAYSDKCNMIKHKRKHSGERPYVCDVCNKAYNDKNTPIRQTHTVVSALMFVMCVIRHTVTRVI